MVYEHKETDAPFNMAVATLMRLDKISSYITSIQLLYPQDSPQKQKVFIEMVKQFFDNSIPLLSDEDVEKFKKEILNLKLKAKLSIKSGIQNTRAIYDDKLEVRLHEILIELQQKTRKYYMPKGRDPSSAIASF